MRARACACTCSCAFTCACWFTALRPRFPGPCPSLFEVAVLGLFGVVNFEAAEFGIVLFGPVTVRAAPFVIVLFELATPGVVGPPRCARLCGPILLPWARICCCPMLPF